MNFALTVSLCLSCSLSLSLIPPSFSPSFSSLETRPHLKVGLGISRTKVDSKWNPVYKAFH